MAIVFSIDPPDGPAFRGMDLVRTPKTGKFAGLITCEAPIGTFTHFWGARTYAHDNDHCPACEAGCAKRWHYYVSIWQPTPKEYVLFECTAAAGIPLLAAYRRLADLRGCYLVAERKTEKPNARVMIKINDQERDKYAMPKPVDIPAILAKIWRTPVDQQAIDNMSEAEIERWKHLTKE